MADKKANPRHASSLFGFSPFDDLDAPTALETGGKKSDPALERIADPLDGLPKKHEPVGQREYDELLDRNDTSPDGLIAFLKGSITFIMQNTPSAKATRLIPTVYVWKNGHCLVQALHFESSKNLTVDRLGRLASSMGTGSEPQHIADAVALMLDVRGMALPSQAFKDQPVSIPKTLDAWAVLLRIREGDRLWSMAQTYDDTKGEKVVWGVRYSWDSQTDPDSGKREKFQLPAWY